MDLLCLSKPKNGNEAKACSRELWWVVMMFLSLDISFIVYGIFLVIAMGYTFVCKTVVYKKVVLSCSKR